MKKIIIALSTIGVLISTSCGNRKIERIDPNTATDISGRWNDTDSKLVAEEMTKDVLNRPWIGAFEKKANRKPVVIIGSVRNKTSEYIDATGFIKNMEVAFINEGRVSVVQSADERNQVRDERNDQQTFSSEETKKKWGKEKGADFMMNGVITSITDEYKKMKTVAYQINLELTDLETNEKVWIGQKQIKKIVKN
ncbi:MAG: penicillin-binding protein activator LpoB [Candidatus Methylacidiphilales bacterium]|nr:penicillin-binding protein activator LpoB [Bacteroidia bacterium]